jgi:hypothetical protein
VLLYHRTNEAEQIRAEGFRDGEGSYLTDRRWRGVWFSDDPEAGDQELPNAIVVAIDVPAAVAADYEWVEEARPYREFLIPADVANRYGPPRVASPAE